MASQQGWSQQTPAIKSLLQTAMGAVRRTSGKRRKKRSKSATASGAKRSRKRSKKAASSRSKKGAALVAGSAAAKAWGKRMKALRKKAK